METIIKIDQEIITTELANAIASFNIAKVAELLSEKGEFTILKNEEEIIISNKDGFIKWLKNCFNEFALANDGHNQLDYTIDQCLHCKIGNPVLVFENGKFPVSSTKLWLREKCGLMLEFDDNLVSEISFCFVFLHTDNPFLFEKKCKRHLD